MATYLQEKRAKLSHFHQQKRNCKLPTSSSGRSSKKEESSTPLLDFINAKYETKGIYKELYVLLNEMIENLDWNFNSDIFEKNEDFINELVSKRLQGYFAKITSIRQILARDQMKVVFFGRTSSGKSAVINAMIHEPLLPSGMGHTTSCFCQVAACENDCDGYVMIDDGNEETTIDSKYAQKQSISSLQDLANAHSKLKLKQLDEHKLVHVFWPRGRCILLQHDVLLVDSPGVDVSVNLDNWIEKHCLNADVFVLVVNAESTMTRAEKHFFHKVSTKISKPSVFILNNRWDASANERPEFIAAVRQQHLDRCTEFLCSELKEPMEVALKRIFFVSAHEMLRARLAQRTGAVLKMAAIGFEQRYSEFLNFEREFEACISRHALHTKFRQHCASGQAMVHDLCAVLEQCVKNMTILCASKSVARIELDKSKRCIELQIMQTQQILTAKINDLSAEVEQKVTIAVNEQIWKVNSVISNFHAVSFKADTPHRISVYKKALSMHLETVIESKLQMELFVPLALKVCQLESEISSLIENIKPNSRMQPHLMTERKQSFEFLYFFNCQQLCSDFEEKLEFRFSMGITTMIKLFTGIMSSLEPNRPVFFLEPMQQQRLDTLSKHLNGIRSIEEAPALASACSNSSASTVQLVVRFAFITLGTEGSIGCLLAAGFLLKTMGWRLIFSASSLLGAFYLYERLTWTNAAKERAFKAQYTRHITRKLHCLVEEISNICSRQTKAELSETLATLQSDLQAMQHNINKEMLALSDEVARLDLKRTHLQGLSDKLLVIGKKFTNFEMKYLNVACEN